MRIPVDGATSFYCANPRGCAFESVYLQRQSGASINSRLANGFRGMKQSSSCYGVVVRPATPSRYCPASQLRMSASPVMTSSVLPSRVHTGSCTYGTPYFWQMARTRGAAFW